MALEEIDDDEIDGDDGGTDKGDVMEALADFLDIVKVFFNATID